MQGEAESFGIARKTVAQLGGGVAGRRDLVQHPAVIDRWRKLSRQILVVPGDGREPNPEPVHQCSAGGAVDWRTISSFGNCTLGCALSSTVSVTPCSMTCSSRSAACSPRRRIGCPTVVSGGGARAASRKGGQTPPPTDGPH